MKKKILKGKKKINFKFSEIGLDLTKEKIVYPMTIGYYELKIINDDKINKQ